MPNADTRTGFAVSDTLASPRPRTLPGVKWASAAASSSASSRCIIINVRSNEGAGIKYDAGHVPVVQLAGFIVYAGLSKQRVCPSFNLPWCLPKV